MDNRNLLLFIYLEDSVYQAEYPNIDINLTSSWILNAYYYIFNAYCCIFYLHLIILTFKIGCKTQIYWLILNSVPSILVPYSLFEVSPKLHITVADYLFLNAYR